MKAALFLAVLVLATQAQTPVHEFFHDFISNTKMDASTKNQVLNDGLECINYALKAVAGSMQNIQYDIAHKDILATLKDALTGAELFKYEAIPRCQNVLIEVATYINYNIKYVSREQAPFLYANLISTAANTLFNAPHQSSEKTAKGLATLFNTAFGFEQIQYPEIPKLDWESHVFVPQEKAIPAFFKGFFTTLGFNNLAQINATYQCVLDIGDTVNAVARNLDRHRGDELSKLNAFLGGVMNVTGAWERCKRLDTVDLSFVSRLFTLLKEDTLRTLFIMFYNDVTALPYILENTMNYQANLWVGQFEAAGQKYANIVKQQYQHILF